MTILTPHKVNHITGTKIMKVVVTTQNSQKLTAVETTFKQKFNNLSGNQKIEVIGVKSNPGVTDGQPYGLDGTFQAALSRIDSLKQIIGSYDCNYIVSIENGIHPMNTNDQCTYLDFPVVIIKDVQIGKQVVQFGGSRPIPLEQMRQMKSQGVPEKERGKWCNEYYSKINLSQTREQLIHNCLIMALEELVL